MKAIQKSVLVFALLLVYGLGCAMLLADVASPRSISNQADTGHYIASPFSDIGFHLPQSESSVSNPTHIPPLPLKESKYTAGMLPLFDAAIRHAFKQLEHFSLSLLLGLRKSELLFPAHFFW